MQKGYLHPMESWAWEEGNCLGSAVFCDSPGSSEPRAVPYAWSPYAWTSPFHGSNSEVRWWAGWEAEPKFLPAGRSTVQAACFLLPDEEIN